MHLSTLNDEFQGGHDDQYMQCEDGYTTSTGATRRSPGRRGADG